MTTIGSTSIQHIASDSGSTLDSSFGIVLIVLALSSTLCIQETGIFANSGDPDEMQHNAAIHQGLHCL